MKRIVSIMFFTAALASAATQTFTGVITDTMCGAKHTMAGGQPDSECVKICVKGSASYALYDGKTSWTLNNAKLAANFAAKKVKVTGELIAKSKSIRVKDIQPLP